jgi:YfiH family protein
MGVPSVKAVVTSRYQENWHLFNLSNGSGNTTPSPGNRIWLDNHISTNQDIVWLRQIHGNRVCDMTSYDGTDISRTGDAAYTNYHKQACAVLTADCLPVLICNQYGTKVAAVHAGWRGLIAGVIENSLDKFDGEPVVVWLGPSISQLNFEVGQDVYDEFVMRNWSYQEFFQPNGIPGKYKLDLKGVAIRILQQYNVINIINDERCTYALPDTFFSYRRDGSSGCLASLIWME